MRDLNVNKNEQATKHYALALYLSSIDRTRQALNALKNIPKKQWDKKTYSLKMQLKVNLILSHARSLYTQGNKKKARAFLLRQPGYLSVLIQLGDWTFAEKDYRRALHYYKKALQKNRINDSAVIGLMETYAALKQPYYVRHLFNQKPWKTYLNSLNNRRRLSQIWAELGHKKQAYHLLKQGKTQAIYAPNSATSSLYLKTLAIEEKKHHHFKEAQNLFKKAMVKSDMVSTYPNSSEAYSLLLRNPEEDDCLKRSLRIEAADLYQQQTHRFILQHDLRQLTGTPGISDFKAEDTMIQYGTPFGAGRIHIRADKVTLHAGKFETNTGTFTEDFGTCTNGCSQGLNQEKTGYSAMAQWQTPQWLLNLGFTPLGFDVFNWVADISYNNYFHDMGWTLSAFHEPYTNSLLSFSGTQDPNSTLTWGGVVASGGELSLSYDQGKAHGVWASLNAAFITGKNVANNHRIMLNSGYYYKLINTNNRRLSIGVTNLLWHFNKNLNHYTLGHGGYFSPQLYTAFSLPINYRFRNDNWSFELGGSGSWSYSKTNEILQFPLPELVPDLTATPNAVFKGGQGASFGYRLLGSVERRLTSHFICGAMIDIQRSPNFTPDHGLLFLKYTLEPWQGTLNMPIKPINAYVYER